MKPTLFLGLSAAGLMLSATVEAGSSCAMLLEPKDGFAMHYTTSGVGRVGDQRLVLSCNAEDSIGVSYRISLTRSRRSGTTDTLATVTGSCKGTCPVRINDRIGAAQAVPGRQDRDVVLVTIDF